MPLVMVLMALTLLTGLGTVLIVGTMTETAVAAAYGQGVATFYAAEAAVEFAVRDLAARANWDAVFTGTEASTLADGPAGAVWRVGGRELDLAHETAEVEALLASRDLPAEAPPQLYAFGTLQALTGTGPDVPVYICAWVAESPAADEIEEASAVRIAYVVGRAYGATGARRTVLVRVAGTLDAGGEPGVEVRHWEEPE